MTIAVRREAGPGGKMVFADQLRGLAAVTVVSNHVFNVYPFAQPMVSATAAVPQVMGLPSPWVTPLVMQSWINLGPSGVRLLFLVSGFVVPFSLARHSRGSFVTARALRTYPTYWAALTVCCPLVVASSRYWGRPVPFHGRQVLTNAGLVHTLRNAGTIDQVNWTLVVELHVYMFASLARPWILRRSLWPMGAAVAGAIGLMAVQRIGWIGSPSFLELEAMSLPLMLIGTAMHYHFVGALQAPGLAAVAAGLAVTVLGLFFASPVTGRGPGRCGRLHPRTRPVRHRYAARLWLPDWRVLRLLARISYPLYAVHMLAALTIMTWLIVGPPGLLFGWASVATLGILLLIATALHLGVERWTTRWGAALEGPTSNLLGAGRGIGAKAAGGVALRGVPGSRPAGSQPSTLA